MTEPRPIAAGQPSLAAGSAPCPAAGDQLAQVEIFGYLPQKFNLKYEMNIVTVASGVTAHSSRGTDECVVNELGDNPELELVSGSGHITSHYSSHSAST